MTRLFLSLYFLVALFGQPTSAQMVTTSPSSHLYNGLQYPYSHLYQQQQRTAAPAYQPSSMANLLQHYEQVRRSQEDMQQISPSVQQLANSLMAAGSNSAPTFESPESANYTSSLDGSNDFYSNPSLYGNMFSQYYPHSVDPATSAAAGSYAISPAALEQYASFLQANQSALFGKGKGNKPTGLGRRIGELVSTSAERASRAFKSFSQIPSRLLGLVSDGQMQGTALADGKTVNASALSASPSSVYFPPNPWSAYMAPPLSSPSNVFYQQPVYMRTQEMANPNGGLPASSVGGLNSLVNPSSIASASMTPMQGNTKSTADFMSDFYSPSKMSYDNPSMYNPAVNAQANSPYPSGSASTAHPLGTSTTTVYHHFSGQNSGNGNGASPGDLFAAPQTQFGVRMKPPKDFDFEGSNEDEMSSGEQDDAKMADQGNGGQSGGRHPMDNNNDGHVNGGGGGGDGRFNERPHGGGSPNGNLPWSSGPSSNSFDEFNEQGTGTPEPDLFNAYNSNSNAQRFRPFNTGFAGHNRPNAFRSVPSRPYTGGIRRPSPLSSPEFGDDSDSWYNTFFGNNVKPMTRLRNLPFANSPMNFAQSASSLLNTAASTPTPTHAEAYMSPYGMRPQAPHTPNYFHFPSAPRPTWPYGMYANPSANSYMNHFRPNPMMHTAPTSMRPVTVPFYPAANYFMPRYPAAYPATNPMMAANPYAMARYPTMNAYPMMGAASSLYPVRVPYSPMLSMPYGMGMSPSTLMPSIVHPPMMRYGFGGIGGFTPTAANRRTMNITKRAEIGGTTDLVDQASNVFNKVSQAIANTIPAVKTRISRPKTSVEEANNNNAVAPNREEQNLATLYNAYQVLQRRMESVEQNEETSTSKPPTAQPYYQYFIGKDTTTTTTTPSTPTASPATSGEASSETLESSARTIPLNFTSMAMARSIKTRHITEQPSEHEKRQAEIRQFLADETLKKETGNAASSPTTTIRPPVTDAPARQAKSVSTQLMAPSNEPWKPLLRVSINRKPLYHNM